MKIVKNKKLQKRTAVIASSIIVVLLLIAGTVFAYTSSTWPFNTPSEAPETHVDPTNPLGADREATSEDNTPTKSPTQYEGSNPNTAPSLTGFISYSSVVDGILVIRVTIDQELSSGTCEISLTKGGESLTRTSSIVANPSSSTCSGFDIPTSGLSSGGWSIEITIASEGKTGTITGEATI